MPRPPKDVAIERLQRVLDMIPELEQRSYSPPGFIRWRDNARVAVSSAFGEQSGRFQVFLGIKYSPRVAGHDRESTQTLRQRAYLRGLKVASEHLQSMIDEIKEDWEDDTPLVAVPSEAAQPGVLPNSKQVFVIHGSDHGIKSEIARFLENLGLEPVILHEQTDQGRTIIEKFEQSTQADFAVALLTPDDVGGTNQSNLQPRARQNVILELGYFIGKLGRSRVCALRQGDVEIPSDISGVLYIPLYDGDSWKLALIRELKNAGFDVDANRAI